MADQKKKVIATLCVVHDDKSILLGMKKKGLGKGKWNSFGGRVEENESIEEAALRELWEESGIKASKLEKYGVLNIIGETENNLELHIFKACDFTGKPQESDEMNPRWFLHEEIPFDNMWPNDKHWLPLILNGGKFKGTYFFENDEMVDFNLELK